MLRVCRWVYLSLIPLMGGCGLVAELQKQGFFAPANSPQSPPPAVSTQTDDLLLGNPSNAGTDPRNYLMQKPQYTLSYNNANHIANWVSWRLQKRSLGKIERRNDFRPDPALPSGWYAVKPSDYNNSGFDRGHLAPSADRTDTLTNNSATFLMSNIVPQTPDNNRGPWEGLESYCRNLALAGKELYITAGGYGKRGAVGQGNAQIVIPERLWKVVVVLDRPNIGKAGVTAKTRVIAVDIPNIQGIHEIGWTTYQVTVRQLETKTGYRFLSNIPQPVQDVIEQRIDRSNPIKNPRLKIKN